eukprot:GABV01008778.1.p1 GENE.GABV01008778.1~~GABV01008778.1.p1  ORF type:complete len:183 (+),score=72.35 GABV01008778.1:160-708(+)
MFLTRADDQFESGKKSYDSISKRQSYKEILTNICSKQPELGKDIRADSGDILVDAQRPITQTVAELKEMRESAQETIALMADLDECSVSLWLKMQETGAAAKKVALLCEKLNNEEVESRRPDEMVDNRAESMQTLLPGERVDVLTISTLGPILLKKMRPFGTNASVTPSAIPKKILVLHSKP